MGRAASDRGGKCPRGGGAGGRGWRRSLAFPLLRSPDFSLVMSASLFLSSFNESYFFSSLQTEHYW